jgi:hypothetical protein
MPRTLTLAESRLQRRAGTAVALLFAAAALQLLWMAQWQAACLLLGLGLWSFRRSRSQRSAGGLLHCDRSGWVLIDAGGGRVELSPQAAVRHPIAVVLPALPQRGRLKRLVIFEDMMNAEDWACLRRQLALCSRGESTVSRASGASSG